MDIDYDKLVEELEEVEDTVECKVCFDLFPKEVCFKTPLGWVCPVCKQEMISHEGNSLDLINATPEDIKYQDPRLPEKVEEEEVLEEPVDGDAIRKHENGIAEDFELPTTVRVADVEYNDDDNVDYHVLVYAGDADADEIEEILYEAGMIFVYVNDIYEKSIHVTDLDKLKIGDVLEVLDESMKEYYRHNQETLEDKTELKGGDCAVVDCQTDHKIIAHSEDEKPLDCLMKKPPLEKPLTEGIFEEVTDGISVLYNKAEDLLDTLNGFDQADDIKGLLETLGAFIKEHEDNLPAGVSFKEEMKNLELAREKYEDVLDLVFNIKEAFDNAYDICTSKNIDESLKEAIKEISISIPADQLGKVKEYAAKIGGVEVKESLEEAVGDQMVITLVGEPIEAEEVKAFAECRCDAQDVVDKEAEKDWDALDWPKSDLGLATPDDSGLWD